MAVPISRENHQGGLTFEVCRTKHLLGERGDREIGKGASDRCAHLWAQTSINGCQLLVVGLVLLEQIEKRERGLFAAIGYAIKIMIEQCDRCPRLGMGADVGSRTHLCIFLTEFEHRKAKFGELFVVFSAHYFHLLQSISIAR